MKIYIERLQSAGMESVLNWGLAVVVLLILTACSTASFKPEPFESVPLRERAESQTFGDLTVAAAVPGKDESQAIFGVPLYDRGIQPVWLEIENRGNERVRFALVSVDRDYFSPLEVSYTMRRGYSKSAREEMDKWFHLAGISRSVDPGETISGFVFTHLSPGTKSFNVDLFGATEHQNFAFFIDVPGFVSDHSEVNFETLYAADQVRDLSAEELRDTLAQFPCCTGDEQGLLTGLPLNVIIVGNGVDVLRALLRAGWYESPAGNTAGSNEQQSPYHLFGRVPDAVFRIQRTEKVERNELRVWLAPMRMDGETVWFGQVTNFVGQRSYIKQALFGGHLDPDVDDARNFLLQNMWYSQGLQSFAWVNTQESVPFDQPRSEFNENSYFTDGYRAVIWLSSMPFSLLETTNLQWDEAPGK